MKKISGYKLIGGIESMGIKLPKKEMIVGEIIEIGRASCRERV